MPAKDNHANQSDRQNPGNHEEEIAGRDPALEAALLEQRAHLLRQRMVFARMADEDIPGHQCARLIIVPPDDSSPGP